jgi:flagellar export protein FliJ
VKKFHFSFQRVMDWREKRAEQERMELLRLRNRGSELAGMREQIIGQIRTTSAALASSTSMSASDLSQAAAFLHALHTGERTVQSQQADCESAIDVQIQKCRDAERDHRLLEKLRARRLTEWKAGYDREAEQAAHEAWQSGRARLPERSDAAD